MPNKGPKAGSIAPKRQITGTIEQTQARLEEQRRYEQSKSNPQPQSDGRSPWYPPFLDKVMQDSQARLEDQRRYDQSRANPTTPSRTTLPGGSLDNLRRIPAAPNSPGNPGGGSSSSSVGGGGGAPAAPTLEEQLAAIQSMSGTIDPRLTQHVPNEGKIGLMYGQFDAAINKNRQDLTKSYDESIAAIKNNYGASSNLLNAAAGQDQATLEQAAKNLGIADYAGSTVQQDLSEQLARFVGSNTGNQAIDLAWFEKLKNLDDTNLANWLAVSQRDKAQMTQDSANKMLELQQLADAEAQALAMQELLGQMGGSGGGGGGGGGYGGRRYGGGGSSGKDPYATLSEAIAETMDQNNVGVSELINSIPDPAMREWAKQQWYLGGGGASAESVPDVIKYLYGQLNTLQNSQRINSASSGINKASGALSWLPGFKNLPTIPGVGKVSGPGGNPQNIIDLINALQQFDPTFGTVTSRSVDSKSAQSTRVPSKPLPEIWANNPPVTTSAPKPKTNPGKSLKDAAKKKLKPSTKKTIKNVF
jgi:hypothetical protein